MRFPDNAALAVEFVVVHLARNEEGLTENGPCFYHLLNPVGLANREDLPHMMLAVNEMKPSPLRNVKRAEDVVARAARSAEELLSLIEDGIEAEKMLAGGSGQGFARERRLRGSRRHNRR